MPEGTERRKDDRRGDGLATGGPMAMATATGVFAPPHITLPKGGGALKGIGESFTADLATGQGTCAIPLALTGGPGAPRISLSYQSGNGNGPFGLGWHLSIPAITRRTDKGLPRYDDASPMADNRDADIVTLSGADDLVPVAVPEGCPDREAGPAAGDSVLGDHVVRCYRPRIEGLFARIERWTRRSDGDIHWRTISHDNVLSLFGADPRSRIADPDDPRRIFSWLLTASCDDRGHVTLYDYVPEDDAGVDRDRPAERRRDRRANRYLRRIRWGNRSPVLREGRADGDGDGDPLAAIVADPGRTDWMFSAVLDYDEGRYQEDPAGPDGQTPARAGMDGGHPWAARQDPFSTFRSGFEIRTHRLCRRLMMFHHIPERLGIADCLVASTGFRYRETPFASFLEEVRQCGHVPAGDGVYRTRSLPPLRLDYSRSALMDGTPVAFTPRDLDPEGLADLAGGVGGPRSWIDLDGEGIAGVLTEQAGEWFYKRNLGEGRLAPAGAVPVRPSLAGGAARRHRLMDIDGDGLLDLVDLSPGNPGVHGRDIEAGWRPFKAFRAVPVIDWTDPDLHFIDLSGDGIPDLLITRDGAVDWRPSDRDEGYGAARKIALPADGEEYGPRLLLGDAVQTIFTADMTGDGLSDLVRIRNGEVCYWPNRGYGRFGAKVSMERPPRFDHPDLFDPRRIRLADVDGTGVTDIVYLGGDGARIYLNESGNGWSTPRPVDAWPAENGNTRTDLFDLLGRGTACLVWSGPLPGDGGRQIRYIDLMDGRKPHLLCRTDNGTGCERRIEYASSTEFYLADRAAGRPWITRLPVPVHVVRRVASWDRVSRSLLVTGYSYHHGYYDGLEREFRGFARVDQTDSESFAGPRGDGLPPWIPAEPPGGETTGIPGPETRVPPSLSRHWFHTGVFLDGEDLARRLAGEFFGSSPSPPTLSPLPVPADPPLPPGLTPAEAREACRALKGAPLRTEVYGLDGTEKAARPYLIEHHTHAVVRLQPRGANRYGVFFTHERETLTLHLERNVEDPRVTQDLTLEVDRWGNVLASASVAYARRAPDHPEQAAVLATLRQRRFTNPVDGRHDHRTPSAAAEDSFELTAPDLAGPDPLPFGRIDALARAAVTIGGRALSRSGRAEKCRIAASRTRYRADDLAGLLAEGQQQSRALPGETCVLALTPDRLALFADHADAGVLTALLTSASGGYRDIEGDGCLWIPSGRVFYSPDPDDPPDSERAVAEAGFFLPRRFRDPFGHDTVVGYDPFLLAPAEVRDAAGNVTRARLDYRVLAPETVIDANGNRSLARYDALGLLAGTALAGKEDGRPEGDSFDRFEPDPSPALLARFFDQPDPTEDARAVLGTATTRFLYDLSRSPVATATLRREIHGGDLAPGQQSPLQIGITYWDGFGREAQSRTLADPVRPRPGDPDGANAATRWIASGATVYNNKGSPVRTYEPFFSPGPRFGIERHGVSSTLFHDPLNRVVAVLHPDQSYEKTVFDAWKQDIHDPNDTVMTDPAEDPDVRAFFLDLPDRDYRPGWYARRIGGALGPAAQDAARKAAGHAGTPARTHADVLGRPFLTVADNGPGPDGARQLFATRTLLDIKGNRVGVIDALGRRVSADDYDLTGTRLRERTMDAGTHWMLEDAMGGVLLAWNSRGYRIRTDHDALRRPVRSHVSGGPSDGTAPRFDGERLFEETIYGDDPRTGLDSGEQQARNLKGRVFAHFDGSGVIRTPRYDFKGNSLESARQFAADCAATPDWSGPVVMEAIHYASTSAYDALNRAITVTAPDDSVYRPWFNRAGLLERVDINCRGQRVQGERVWTPFVLGIDYNAKGQRRSVDYANGVRTTYTYDRETFRLVRLVTRRRNRADAASVTIFESPGRLQDLCYAYDPVGNVTRIVDRALRTVFHGGERAGPERDYGYDPTYRLIFATGREHRHQSALSFAPSGGHYRDFPFVGAAHPHDMQALRPYRESYDYDPAGNPVRVRHHATGGGWERLYRYADDSGLEPGRIGNRLSAIATGDGPATLVERFRHDAHGNVTEMPHLPRMIWDFHDQLAACSRQLAPEGGRDLCCYNYDGAGQRSRKVTLRADGRRRSERLYVGGFEIFRDFDADGAVRLERQTLHVMDDIRRIALIETLTIRDGAALPAPRPLARFQLDDHLGSATVELDETGALLSWEDYAPYGTTTVQSAPRGGGRARKRYRFTGRERDDESGLSYHGARYLAPWLGRWISADPAGLADGVNPFAYARQNPVRLTDPHGLAGGAPDPTAGRNPTANRAVGLAEGEGGLADLVGAKQDIVARGEVIKPGKGGSIIDLRTKYRSLESKVIDLGTKSYRKGKELTEVRLSQVRHFIRRVVKQAVKHEEALKEAGIVSEATGEPLKETVVVTVKGARTDAEYAATAKKIRDTAKATKTGIKVGVLRAGQRGAVSLGVMKGIAGVSLSGVFGVIAYHEFKQNVKEQNYGKALASGAGVVESGTSIFATAASGFTGVSTSSVALGTSVGGMGAGEAIAAAPHVVGAFAVGAAVGVGIQEGSAYLSKKYLGYEVSPGQMIGDSLTATDRTISGLFADPSKPAYTQTLGWKIASWLTPTAN